MKIEGQVALVTGGAGGIGKALAQALLQRGAKVCIADVSEEKGQSVASELSQKFNAADVTFVKCDVTDKGSFWRAFAKTIATFGGIHIVCNNAGICDEMDWTRIIQVNYNGVIWGTELALEYMGRHKGNHGGVVINTASLSGLYPSPETPIFSGTQAAIVMFTASMAHEVQYTRHGIRLNCICPGLTETPLVQDIRDTSPAQGFFQDMEHRAVIMKPTEVADAAMELIMDDSKNGAMLQLVDGHKDYYKIPRLS